MHPVELCQMCVAFGLVYLGLKEARYRIRTYQAIANGIKGLAGLDTDSLAYTSLLRAEPHFAKCHHLIADATGMLPDKYMVDMDSSLVRLVKYRESKANLWIFQFYNSNWDNWIVFASSVVLPMLLMLAYHVGLIAPQGATSNASHQIAVTVAIIYSMLTPAVFVFLGMRMYMNMNKRISGAVRYISQAYANVDTESNSTKPNAQ